MKECKNMVYELLDQARESGIRSEVATHDS